MISRALWTTHNIHQMGSFLFRSSIWEWHLIIIMIIVIVIVIKHVPCIKIIMYQTEIVQDTCSNDDFYFQF